VFPILFAAMGALKKIESMARNGNQTRNSRPSITSPSGASTPTGEKSSGKKAKEDYTLSVKPHILAVLKAVDTLLNDEPVECFRQREWLELLEEDGVRFDDAERMEWVCKAVERGLKGETVVLVYQVGCSVLIYVFLIIWAEPFVADFLLLCIYRR
jgi:hypothetical protein